MQLLSGQCPDKSALWSRIVFLRDSTKIPPQDQLNELLEIERKASSCKDNIDSAYALLLSRIGALYNTQKDYVSALSYTKRSIALIQSNKGKPSISEKPLVRSYNNLRVFYTTLHRLKDKFEAVDSCLAIAIRTGSIDKFSMFSLREKIEHLFHIGDYHRCLEYLDIGDQVNPIYVSLTNDDYYTYYLLAERINVLILLKEFKLAKKTLEEKSKSFSAEENRSTATLHTLMGRVLMETGSYENALIEFRRAIPGFLKDSAYTNYAELMNNFGYLYFQKLNNPDNALTYYKKALATVRQHKSGFEDPLESLNILANIATAHAAKSNFDSAFIYYQQAFNELKPGVNEHSLLSSSEDEFITYGNSNYLSALYADKGNAYLTQYRIQHKTELLQNAISVFRSYDQFLDKIKNLHAEISTKLFWRRDTRKLYEQAIEASYQAQSTADAFYFFEKSRAVLLNDQLNQQKWMNETEILQEAQIRKNILLLNRDRSNPEKANMYAQIDQELIQLKQELLKLENSIKNNNPFYYQSYFDTSFVSIDNVRETLLKDRQAVIESFTGDSSVYYLIITPKDIFFRKIKKEEFDLSIAGFTRFLSNPNLLNANYPEFLKVSSGLYRLIFANTKIPAGRIIISQDQQNIPFEALVTNNGSQPEFLISKYAVSYAYSCRFLFNDFELKHTGSSKDFFGVAPINFASKIGLPTLSGSDRSLAKLDGFFSRSDEIVADYATKRNFLDRFPKYKIVQLYTHAADTSASGEPVIYFADSALYLSELIREEVPAARLIVLSACETGLGELNKGEGVFSFNRGFAALGIPAAVTTLWSVDAESTYQITELFYKYLSKGFPTDIALQKAKLEFLKTASKEKSLPYFWAGPILSGKTETIEFSNSNPLKWIALAVGLALIISLFYWLKTRNKKTLPISR